MKLKIKLNSAQLELELGLSLAIIKTQKVTEEVLVAKRIDREIVEITSKKSVPIVDTLEESIEKEVNEVNNLVKGKRKCRVLQWRILQV